MPRTRRLQARDRLQNTIKGRVNHWRKPLENHWKTTGTPSKPLEPDWPGWLAGSWPAGPPAQAARLAGRELAGRPALPGRQPRPPTQAAGPSRHAQAGTLAHRRADDTLSIWPFLSAILCLSGRSLSARLCLSGRFCRSYSVHLAVVGRPHSRRVGCAPISVKPESLYHTQDPFLHYRCLRNNVARPWPLTRPAMVGRPHSRRVGCAPISVKPEPLYHTQDPFFHYRCLRNKRRPTVFWSVAHPRPPIAMLRLRQKP